MRSLLENIYGRAFSYYKQLDPDLPLFLKDGHSFFEIEIFSQKIILVSIDESSRFNITSLKKNETLYINKLSTPIAYSFEHITTFQRKSMVENSLPFISKNGQIFLPFLGSYFQRCNSIESSPNLEHFTPTSQLLFLLLLYSDDDFMINKSSAASILEVTPMSISRASRQLMDLKLIEQINIGTNTLLHRTLSKIDSLKVAESYLIYPVSDTISVEDTNELDILSFSGEYALTLCSSLGYPRNREFAVYKKRSDRYLLTSFSSDLTMRATYATIQLWKYDPSIFSINNIVDPVSLMCCFKDTKDERIEKCLDDIKEDINSWKISISS